MVPGRCGAALLLFLGALGCGHSLQTSLEEIVSTRLLAGFKEGCDMQATAIRNLGIAVKAAYGNLRRREGKVPESVDLLLMEVDETSEEDNSSYTRKLMSFKVRPLSDPEGDVLEGATASPSEDKCLVTRLHLKRVGVSVVSLAECPLVAAEVDVAVSAFRHDDCISFVERDSIVRLYPTFEGPPASSVFGKQEPTAPGDPPSLAYWLEVTGIDRAWVKQTCVRDVVVAVIDTGVAYNHPDLKRNMWRNEYEILGNGVDDDRNGYVDDIHGYDFYSKKAEVTDDHGHGTHCAGIIGAVPETTTAQGVCKTVSIAGLRFMDAQGSGATSDAIEAINYAIEMDFHITTNSWGGPDVSAGLMQAIERAAAVDQLFVAAAGNSGNSADSRPEYPGAYKVDNVISVAATDEADRLANFSNYGKSSVHIAAPGVFIVSTFPPATSKSLSGTSMAAPVVAGISAMVLSVRPMPVKELKELLFATADRPRTLKNKVISDGRVSAAFAICAAATLPPTTQPQPEPEPEPEPGKAEFRLSRSLKKRFLPQAGG